ncbi:GH3 auxin-responsive promoter family protein [Ralstonia sp. 1138]|uniref:GH3 family domain-containing protein n=1 Tax=Ralstonia sp. 1138 TaxID=3156423 RepID=UPI003398F27A
MSRRLKVGVSFLVSAVATAMVGVLGSAFALRRIILSSRPESRQRRLLANILRHNATSEYGRKHSFSTEICSLDTFLEEHPIVDYEGLRDWVERSVECGRNLLADVDLFRLSTTSGTTGQPKVILQSRLLYRREYLEYTLAVLFRILLADPRSLMRPLGIIAAASERKRIGAVESSSAASTLYRTSPFRRFAALPPGLFEVRDSGARYYYYSLFLMACRCRCIVTPNPTTVLEVLDAASRHAESFLIDLRLERLDNRFGLPDATWRQIDAAWADLAAWSSSPRALFEDVRTIVTWTGGSCGFFARRLSERLPRCRVLELGYLATDSPICVPVGMSRQVLASDSVFAEFVPIEEGDARPRRYSELEQGKLYEIVLTNRYGLYRYAMHDVVRVSGRVFGSACLEFVRKTAGFSNITGEKLSEDQVCAALAACEAALGLSIHFFVAIPDLETRGYDVFCELEPATSPLFDTILPEQFDAALRELNVEYRSKRGDGRLRRPRFILLAKGAGKLYKHAMLARGARDVQFKVRHLQSDGANREFLASMAL